MLSDLLNIQSLDLAEAKEIYQSLPKNVEVPALESCPSGFDFQGYLLQCVADTFNNSQNAVHVHVYWNYLDSQFNLTEDDTERLKKLEKAGNELAAYILEN